MYDAWNIVSRKKNHCTSYLHINQSARLQGDVNVNVLPFLLLVEFALKDSFTPMQLKQTTVDIKKLMARRPVTIKRHDCLLKWRMLGSQRTIMLVDLTLSLRFSGSASLFGCGRIFQTCFVLLLMVVTFPS